MSGNIPPFPINEFMICVDTPLPLPYSGLVYASKKEGAEIGGKELYEEDAGQNDDEK
jgi:hypothetical protein